MDEFDFDIEFFCYMLGSVLGAIYRSVLTAGTTIGNHQVCEPTVDVSLHRGIDKRMEFYDLGVETRVRLVPLVFSRIVDSTAVENETAAVAGRIVWYAFLVCEAENADCELLFGQFVGELFKIHKAVQQLVEVWIFLVRPV